MLFWDLHLNITLLWDPDTCNLLFWDPHTLALFCFEIHTLTLCCFEIHSLTLCFFETHTLSLCCFEMHILTVCCFEIYTFTLCCFEIRTLTLFCFDIHTVTLYCFAVHTLTLFCLQIYTLTLCCFEIHSLTLCCFEIHAVTLCCFEIHTLKLFCFDIHTLTLCFFEIYAPTFHCFEIHIFTLCCFEILILSFYTFCVMVTLVQNLLSSGLLFDNIKIKMYRIIITPVFVYGCEARSVTLKDEHGLRVFQNRVLLKTFGSKRVELTGNRRQLHIEELHNFYSSPNIWMMKWRRVRWVGHVWEMRVAYGVLVRKLKGKRPLGRPNRRLKESIKMRLQEIGWESMDWINLTRNRDKWWAVVNVTMNHQVSQNARSFLTSCEMVDCSTLWNVFVRQSV